jgi:hypothetical protein
MLHHLEVALPYLCSCRRLRLRLRLRSHTLSLGTMAFLSCL